MKSTKIMALGLAATMLLASTTALATKADGQTLQESKTVIVEDDMLNHGMVTAQNSADTKIVTVSEIDSINDERLEAVAAGDEQRYLELTNLLHSYGVQEATPAEVAELTGEDMPVSQSSDTRNGITYDTYNTTYTYSGVTYDILRILATPVPGYSRDTVPYKTGNVILTNSKPAKASIMHIIGTAASSTAGTLYNKLGVVQTAYSFFKDSCSELSSTTEITNIKASYVWNTALACSFIYVRVHSSNTSYDLRGLYHKASAAIAVTVPQLAVAGNQNILAYMLQNNLSGTATPTNYDSTLKAVQGFVNKQQFRASIEGVTMTGVEDKTIKSITFSLPMTPSEAGY